MNGVVVRASPTASGYDISVHEDDGSERGGALIEGPELIVLRDAINYRNRLCERLSDEYDYVRSHGAIFVKGAVQ